MLALRDKNGFLILPVSISGIILKCMLIIQHKKGELNQLRFTILRHCIKHESELSLHYLLLSTLRKFY